MWKISNNEYSWLCKEWLKFQTFFFMDFISSRIDLVFWWISRKDKSWYKWLIKDSIFVFFFFDGMVPFLIPSFFSSFFTFLVFRSHLIFLVFIPLPLRFRFLFFLGSFLIKILIILFPFILSDSMASKRGLQIKEKSSVYINNILKKWRWEKHGQRHMPPEEKSLSVIYSM